MEITKEDLEAFFKAQGVSVECSACGEYRWSVISEVNGEDIGLLIGKPRSDSPSKPTQSLIVILCSCSKCGNVWAIDKTVVEAGKEESTGGSK